MPIMADNTGHLRDITNCIYNNVLKTVSYIGKRLAPVLHIIVELNCV